MKTTIFLITVLHLIVTFVTAADVLCKDVDTEVCAMMHNMNSSMCNDSCLANICKQTCNKCPLTCYQCNGVTHPDECNTTTVCPGLDYQCRVTRSMDDSFQDIFNLGCSPKELCTEHFTPLIIGKRHDNKRSLDGRCCKADRCNNRRPEDLQHVNVDSDLAPYVDSSPATLGYNFCADMSPEICTRLNSSMPNMCSDECVQAVLCPRFCKRCLDCYHCSHIDRPEDCTNSTTCEQGQKCFSLKTLNSRLEHKHTLGCMDKYVCENFHSELPEGFGRRRQETYELSLNGACCTDNLCNNKELFVPTTQPPPTTTTTATTTTTTTTTPSTPSTMPTTTTPTTTTSPSTTTTSLSQGCAAKFGQFGLSHGCPPGFTEYRNVCYLYGSTPRTWMDAKQYCHTHCAELATFTSASYGMAVVEHLTKTHYSSFLFLGSNHVPHFYIDAHYENDHWVWSSTGFKVSSFSFSASDHGKGHDCGSVTKHSSLLQSLSTFAADNCLSTNPFICQFHVSNAK